MLAPMDLELRGVAKAMRLSRSSTEGGSHSGRVGDVTVVAALAGMGPTPAAAVCERLIRDAKPDHVVVVGIAGGLDPLSRIGDLIVPARVVDDRDGAEFDAAPLGALKPVGSMVTTDGLSDPTTLDRYRVEGQVAVDMENAGVAAVCSAHGVPWTAFRAISDLVSDGWVDDSTAAMVREDGTTDLGVALRGLARRPWTIPRMARLGRDSSIAVRVASHAADQAIRFARDLPVRSAQYVPDMGAAEDELAVRTVVANAARFADGPDIDAYVGIFTEDAEWLMPGAPRKGQTEIRAGSEERRAERTVGPGSNTRHVVSTVTVQLDGDHAVAESTWQFYGDTTTTPVLRMIGVYRDDLVRVGADWRIARRAITIG